MPTDPEVLAFIARADAFYPANANELPIAENRAYYDRFAAELRGPPPPGVTWSDFRIAAEGREIPTRRYTGGPSHACILYMHGGGYILGGLESHHDVCLWLCAKTRLDLVAVDYRLAPEHVHPAQGDDCEAAFLHVAAEGSPIVVAGDSAGGNLAAGLCLRRLAKGAPAPVGQVLAYAGLGGDIDSGSFIENANAPMLTRAEAIYFGRARTGGLARRDWRDPDLAPLRAGDVAGLPPAFLVSADLDPLRDDSEAYARKMQAAGVNAQWRNEPQLVHGFLRARAISKRASASFDAICEAIVRFAGAR
jgi:acetyl esterase